MNGISARLQLAFATILLTTLNHVSVFGVPTALPSPKVALISSDVENFLVSGQCIHLQSTSLLDLLLKPLKFTATKDSGFAHSETCTRPYPRDEHTSLVDPVGELCSLAFRTLKEACVVKTGKGGHIDPAEVVKPRTELKLQDVCSTLQDWVKGMASVHDSSLPMYGTSCSQTCAKLRSKDTANEDCYSLYQGRKLLQALIESSHKKLDAAADTKDGGDPGADDVEAPAEPAAAAPVAAGSASSSTPATAIATSNNNTDAANTDAVNADAANADAVNTDAKADAGASIGDAGRRDESGAPEAHVAHGGEDGAAAANETAGAPGGAPGSAEVMPGSAEVRPPPGAAGNSPRAAVSAPLDAAALLQRRISSGGALVQPADTNGTGPVGSSPQQGSPSPVTASAPSAAAPTQAGQAGQAPQPSQAAQESQASQPSQAPQTSQALQPGRMPQALQPPQAGQLGQESQAPQAVQAGQESQAPQAGQESQAPQAGQAAQESQAPQAGHAAQAGQAPQAPQVGQAAQESQAPQAGQAGQAAQAAADGAAPAPAPGQGQGEGEVAAGAADQLSPPEKSPILTDKLPTSVEEPAENPAENPDVPAENPDLPAENPDLPAENPAAPAEKPPSAAETQEAPPARPTVSAPAPKEPVPGIPDSLEGGGDGDLSIDEPQPVYKAPSGALPPDQQPGLGPYVGSGGTLPVQSGDSNFFAYFLTAVVLCIVLYLAFHNKQKILALVIEGRGSAGRRRPHSSQYRRLDNSLEESISSQQRREVANSIIY